MPASYRPRRKPCVGGQQGFGIFLGLKDGARIQPCVIAGSSLRTRDLQQRRVLNAILGFLQGKRATPQKKRRAVANWFLREPHWLVRDGLLALVFGGLLLGLQVRMDERLSERELAIENARAKQAERLENLRYVRERSDDPTGLEGGIYKSFENLDLTGMNLSGLNLPRSLFWRATLDRTDFTSARLEGSSFGTTTGLGPSGTAEGAIFRSARLERAMFYSWDGDGADLSGAVFDDTEFMGGSYNGTRFAEAFFFDTDLWDIDLSRTSGLETAHFEGDCFRNVIWPAGFEPPPIAGRCGP